MSYRINTRVEHQKIAEFKTKTNDITIYSSKERDYRIMRIQYWRPVSVEMS